MAGYSRTSVDKAGRVLAARSDGLDEAVEVVDWWRAVHERPLSVVASNLFRYVSAEGAPIVTQRLKRVPTIAEKLSREKGMRLTQMEDIGGVRAVLPDQDAAYRVARQLRRNWTITRFRDYVVDPKPDGYRALHLINRHRGRLIEIQLRTPNQDEWANAVERARQEHPELRTGGGPMVLRESFAAISEIYAILDGSREMPEISHLLELQETVGRGGTFHQRHS